MSQNRTPPFQITILGAGSWGTALASACCRAGLAVMLWARNPELAYAIQASHENPCHFPGTPLNPQIQATADLKIACSEADFFIIAIPTQNIRDVMKDLADIFLNKPLIVASKGIENETGLLIHEFLEHVLPNNPVVTLSGPNLAHEVVAGLPCGTTIATPDETLGKKICQVLHSSTFHPSWNPDIIGTQVAGALKNVIAIGCGMVKGKHLGENASSTVMSKGLIDMVTFGKSLGAKPQTFFNLAGIGDLVLTCHSLQSRNTAFGMELGSQAPKEDMNILKTPLVEGVLTAFAVLKRWQHHPTKLPIIYGITQVLKKAWTVEEAIDHFFKVPLEDHDISF